MPHYLRVFEGEAYYDNSPNRLGCTQLTRTYVNIGGKRRTRTHRLRITAHPAEVRIVRANTNACNNWPANDLIGRVLTLTTDNAGNIKMKVRDNPKKTPGQRSRVSKSKTDPKKFLIQRGNFRMAIVSQ